MVSCQEPSPLKGSKHSLQCHPHDAALVNALSFVSMEVEARCRPSKSAAHLCHMKRQPFCNGCPCCGHCHCHCRRNLRCHCHSVAIAIAVAVAVAVTIAHCCCHCHWPLRLRSPSTIAATISIASPSAIAVTFALAVGHCRLCHRRPSQLPTPLAITIAMPLAISESCCLSAARVVFDHLKQRMLTLFVCVGTVGGALIEAGWLTRCWVAMANTSIGRRAASSELLQLIWKLHRINSTWLIIDPTYFSRNRPNMWLLVKILLFYMNSYACSNDYLVFESTWL